MSEKPSEEFQAQQQARNVRVAQGVLHPSAAEYESRLKAAEEEIIRIQQQSQEVGEQLEFDRTALADAITGIKKAMDSRYWLTEGRGSYEWDDDRFREEFTATYRELKAAVEPLKKIAANWAGCPKTSDQVAVARVDLRQRIAELEQQAQERDAELTTRDARVVRLTAEVERLQGLVADFGPLFIAYEALDEQRMACEDCEDRLERAAEACGRCFPFADDARLKMRAALAKVRGEA